ncbi:GerMN domain-containing protein [Bacillus massiliigorillae]|uniref:GerMN domain-containing protein n=1 Tax=Bacillus massiliigorillae TaxID=1243664 RepID=UPI0003A129CB|nr:GerMN domain-containing protein [Bacillus massiliigorillae]
MSKKTNVAIVSTLLASSVLLGGCGLFGEGKKEIDPPQKETIVDDGAALENKSDKETVKTQDTGLDQSVMTELYLIDKNGYVVPQSMALPNSKAVAKQALQYLVANGPVSNLLPDGFRAVLPADTQVDVDINEKGLATVDFSKEFANYKAEDEKRILDAITWTLTQFDVVKDIKLQVNGHRLTEMPVNKTPISKTLSRASGINMDTSNVSDITNTTPLTVYYLGGKENNYYYVPVTKRISASEDNVAKAVVKELAQDPSANLVTEFMSDLSLISDPTIKGGKAVLNFNESIYGSFKEQTVSQRLLDALVLSLTEQKGIKSVEVQVNGKASLKTEDGKDLSEPVSRPEKVNSTSL